jgi:hypothetical protein
VPPTCCGSALIAAIPLLLGVAATADARETLMSSIMAYAENRLWIALNSP